MDLLQQEADKLKRPRRSFSVDEIAERNGISRTKTFGEIAAGRLTARKVGRRTIVTADDEMAWLNGLPRA